MEKQNLKYFKEQFLKNEKFKKHKDLLNHILKDDTLYSIKDVEKHIYKYLEEVI